MEIAQSNRKLWIDALRSIAMILVVYGHCVREWTSFYVFTSPIKMPLFFMISGYLFKSRGGRSIDFFKNILRKLVIPWIVLGMIHYTNPVDRFFNLVTGTALWFMPCLIIGEIIWFYIQKYTKSILQVVIFALLVSIIGLLLAHHHILDVAMINTALIVQAYFLVGFLIKTYEDVIQRNIKSIIVVGIAGYLLLTTISLKLFPEDVIDVHLNNYFNLPYCVFVIGLGCLSLFAVFNFFDIKTKWLVYIGQNTLIIYIAHGFFLTLFNALIPSGYHDMISMPINSIIRTAFSCSLCCLVAWFINRYVPEVIGKKRR